MRFKKLNSLIFLTVALLGFTAYAPIAAAASSSDSSTYAYSKGSTQAIWSGNRSQGLSPEANALAHWKKHGREFPQFKNAAQYITAANAFVRTPPKGTLTKMEEDGDKLFYEPKTNTFAVATSRGIPRTMFKPSRGKAYYDAQ